MPRPFTLDSSGSEYVAVHDLPVQLVVFDQHAAITHWHDGHAFLQDSLRDNSSCKTLNLRFDAGPACSWHPEFQTPARIGRTWENLSPASRLHSVTPCYATQT